MTHLTEQELSLLTELNTNFAKAKMGLGDLEIQKSMLLNDISTMKREFDAQEKSLIEKYGADAIINLKTGEITYEDKE
jgi:hypothetical protein